MAQVGVSQALAGEKNEALRTIRELQDISAKHYVSPYGVAQIYAALNDKEHTYKWLETAYRDRAVWMSYLAVDPLFGLCVLSAPHRLCNHSPQDRPRSTRSRPIGHHRNHQRRGMLRVVQDRISRRDGLPARRLLPSGIQVAIKTRKIAAGNLQAHDVSVLKDITGRPKIH